MRFHPPYELYLTNIVWKLQEDVVYIKTATMTDKKGGKKFILQCDIPVLLLSFLLSLMKVGQKPFLLLLLFFPQTS